MVMFNPRLASGDVGVGLSIRRMRDNFLSRFTTTYSLRPIADVGSVFRRYPGMWQVRWGPLRSRVVRQAGGMRARVAGLAAEAPLSCTSAYSSIAFASPNRCFCSPTVALVQGPELGSLALPPPCQHRIPLPPHRCSPE